MKKKKLFLWIPIISLLILVGIFVVLLWTRATSANNWEILLPKWIAKSENNVVSFIGRKVCESKGDFWYWGTASGRNGFTCTTAFEDSGKECKNTSDCMGECEYLYKIPEGCKLDEVNEYFCSEGISGTCSKVEYNNPAPLGLGAPGKTLYYKDWIEVNNNYLYINNWSKYKE
jgi:hypothetical protein